MCLLVALTLEKSSFGTPMTGQFRPMNVFCGRKQIERANQRSGWGSRNKAKRPFSTCTRMERWGSSPVVTGLYFGLLKRFQTQHFSFFLSHSLAHTQRVVAAVGSGLFVYNTKMKTVVAYRKFAHDSDVLYTNLLHNGYKFIFLSF